MIELKNIWLLVKTGFIENEERSLKELVFFFLKMFFILLIFKVLTFGIACLLESFDIFKIPVNLNRSKFENSNDFEILFLMAAYAPILEELTYRLPLKFSKWNLTISLMGSSWALLRIFTEIEYLYCSIFSVGIGGLFYFFLKSKRIEILRTFWIKNKLIVFYSLLLVFSFLHIINYEITAEVLLFSPIIILPRILGALVYS